MDQSEFISRVANQPEKFAWFLGAGASHSAGLPTAVDLIWDIKRRRYCRDENQAVSPNDLQNSAVRSKIDDYMISKGFPSTDDPTSYTRTFELEFGNDYERQRQYLRAILSEEVSSLTLGHRILGGLISSGRAKVAFTTNFDTVVERATAEVGGVAISPFHLEGAYAAKAALNNDEFPVYCKLHGDFRYRSLKNLEEDLKAQNEELSSAFLAAGPRFGLIVTGYSGRDSSIMELMSAVLDGTNPFPHGLYWMGLKGREPLQPVTDLLAKATSKGVDAHLVEIETFDAIMSRLWKQIPKREPALLAKIGRTDAQRVIIPLSGVGTQKPIVRINALPVVRLPADCLELTFAKDKDWTELQEAERLVNNRLICTRGSAAWAWGDSDALKDAFGADLLSTKAASLTADVADLSNNLHLKGFLERALGLGLARNKPLIYRTWRGGSVLILDPAKADPATLAAMKKAVGGNVAGSVHGLQSEATDEFPVSIPVGWAEAVKLDLEEIDGTFWAVLRPDVWIWPKRSRKLATDFLEERTKKRMNASADALLSAWVNLLLPGDAAADVEIAPFIGSGPGHPTFILNRRTGFSRRSVA